MTSYALSRNKVPSKAGEQAARPPVLLVPGAFAGEWFYQDSLAPHFEAQGYQVFCVSFKSQQHPRAQLSGYSLKRYQADLREEIAAISAAHGPPIVIAHSMGGLVLLSLLPELKLPAAVLLTPAVPEGLLAHWGFYRRQSKPSLAKFAAFMIYPPVRFWTAKPPLGLFSSRVPQATIERVNQRLQAESWLAIGSMAVGINLKLNKVTTPCLTVAAGQDGIVPPAAVKALAAKLDSKLLHYPEMAHLLTFEPDWPNLADDLSVWLEQTLSDNQALD